MLPKLEGFAAALLGRLDAAVLATVAHDLEALDETVRSRGDLSAVLTDTSIAPVARGNVVRELLRGKVRDESSRLAVYAAEQAPAQEVPHALNELAHVARVLADGGDLDYANLSLLDARRRVGGYADAFLEEIESETFSSIEDDLFRWARTVEANDELRRLLVDRDAPLSARLGITEQLLTNKVNDVSLALATYVVVGGRPRDVVGTLDFLVNYVARARDWRVARVHTARALSDESRAALVDSLRQLTGKDVELHVAEETALLGGVLVEIGDLRLDATTRGRLGSLRDAVASSRPLASALNRND